MNEPHYAGHRERLRQRYRRTGPEGLAEYELLELLLTYAIARKDVKPLAKDLLRRFGGIEGVLSAKQEDLTAVAGIGPSTAVLIRLAGECGRLCLKRDALDRYRLSSPEALYEYYRAEFGRNRDEEFRCFFVDAQNQIIADETIERGTVDQTVVYPRKVLERALFHKASGLIVAHNHPSGTLTPSGHDLELTRTLARSAEPMGIRLLDHVIVSSRGYMSFRDQGLL